MSSVYFIGDLHLGHKSIGKYRQQFENEDQHYLWLKANWDSVVNKHDKVFVMGDCAFTKERLNDFKQWKGMKTLILGNHDYPAKGISLLDLNDVFNGHVYSLYKHREFWLSHAPIHTDELRGRVNIHGHTHYHLIDDTRYVNVCPEHTYGKPVSIDNVRRFVVGKTSPYFDYKLGEKYGTNN